MMKQRESQADLEEQEDDVYTHEEHWGEKSKQLKMIRWNQTESVWQTLTPMASTSIKTLKPTTWIGQGFQEKLTQPQGVSCQKRHHNHTLEKKLFAENIISHNSLFHKMKDSSRVSLQTPIYEMLHSFQLSENADYKTSTSNLRRSYTESELSRTMSGLDVYDFILHIVGLENFLPKWKSKDPVLGSGSSCCLF